MYVLRIIPICTTRIEAENSSGIVRAFPRLSLGVNIRASHVEVRASRFGSLSTEALHVLVLRLEASKALLLSLPEVTPSLLQEYVAT